MTDSKPESRGDLVASSNGTLHLSTGEVTFTAHGEKKKMKCGVLLNGVGHPFDEFMVKDHRDRGDLCGRCFG